MMIELESEGRQNYILECTTNKNKLNEWIEINILMSIKAVIWRF